MVFGLQGGAFGVSKPTRQKENHFLRCTHFGYSDCGSRGSLLKDAVNHFGDLADDGKPNDSFKP